MATHSGALAWRIPWTEEPGGLQSMGSLRVGHDWASSLSLFTFHFHALEREVATHSTIVAWRIPGTEEPGGLLSMRSQSWPRLAWLSSSTAGYTIHFQVKVISKLPWSYGYNPPESYLFTCSALIISCLIAVKYFSMFSFQSNYINPFLKWPQAHKYYIMI